MPEFSNGHSSSIVPITSIVTPTDSSTIFLAHYDITENEVLSGIAPISGAVFTLRPYEGKFGGGIVVEEATTNYINDYYLFPNDMTISTSVDSIGKYFIKNGTPQMNIVSKGNTGNPLGLDTGIPVYKDLWYMDYETSYRSVTFPVGTYFFEDLDNDVYDSYGFFSLKRLSDGAMTPVDFVSGLNGPDDETYEYQFYGFGCTWKIIHGWVTQGIYKIVLEQTDGTPIDVSLVMGGNYGSDGNDIYSSSAYSWTGNLSGQTRVLHVSSHSDGSGYDAPVYYYWVPYEPAKNGGTQNWSRDASADDEVQSCNFKNGITFYLAIGMPVHAWILADLKEQLNSAGLQLQDTFVPAGSKYTLALDLMSEKPFNLIWDAEVFTNNYANGDTARVSTVFSSTSYTTPNIWKRFSLTTDVAAGALAPFARDILNVDLLGKKIYYRNAQLERKPFATSYTAGSRLAGNLNYPLEVSADVFTISFWYKNTSTSLFGFYIDLYTPDDNNRVFFRPTTTTSMGGGRVVGGATNHIGETAILDTNNWHMYTLKSNGSIMAMYQDGKKIKENTVPTLGTLSKTLMLNSRGQGGIFDELRVDNVARSDDEILSWYISGAPFAPRGVWNIAY